ncbi:hypothetical protein R3W88_004266 [Solanum pinnatisectum]|uniref:Uncharacterized protein n=1 Tax=Solanum pinnatisectum TaxID=50273 RepID=A0AAV9KA40_9SOLN|nr:hypothetical protein R3W88_004266 [Solanum pinnatisectum]
MKENNVGIIAVLEHKIKEKLAEKVLQKIATGWKWEANYEYIDKGRIWLLWNPTVLDCKILGKSDQYIYSSVEVKRNNMIFCLVAVYGLHTIHTRKQLWEDLKQMVSNVRVPMICVRIGICLYNPIRIGIGLYNPIRIGIGIVIEIEIGILNSILLGKGLYSRVYK